MKTLREIGEDALIERLIALVPQDSAPGARPGDDCAVIDRGGPSLQLLKTDALVEGIHFLPETPARKVGWKAIARVVSDLAAMGGRPEHFLVTLALPAEREVAWVEDLYRGMGDCMKRFGSFLAGGETSSVPTGSAAVISIAATGSVAREHLVRRSTGRPGDALWVTGRLGGSLLSGKHLDFIPRLEQAAWLAQNHRPTAMMDLSDGLAKDLPRLAAASGCGYRIDAAALPLNPGCEIAQALTDGEDYELLLAMEDRKTDKLLAEWRQAFPDLLLTRIGELVAPDCGQTHHGGWEHFSA